MALQALKALSCEDIIFCCAVIDVSEEGSESGKRKEKCLICPSKRAAPNRMRAAEERVGKSWRVLSNDV